MKDEVSMENRMDLSDFDYSADVWCWGSICLER